MSEEENNVDYLKTQIEEKDAELESLRGELSKYAAAIYIYEENDDRQKTLEELEKQLENKNAKIEKLRAKVKRRKRNSGSDEDSDDSANEADAAEKPKENGEAEQNGDSEATGELTAITEESDDKGGKKPVESTEYYEADSSKLIRKNDLNNVDILLTTILREMQDMKAKVQVIERSVLLGESAAGIQGPRITINPPAIQAEESYKPPKHEEHYKEAYLEKSFQLETLNRELIASKTTENKLASEKRQERFKPRSSYVITSSKHDNTPTSARAASRDQRVAVGPRPTIVQSARSSSRRSVLTSSRPGVNVTGSSKLKSILKANESSYKTEKPSSEDELTQYNVDLVEDDDEKTNGYQGRVRPADDFDWTSGVNVPSAGLTQETFDNGNKYLRKVHKRYDKEVAEGTRRVYGDDNDIENQLRNNFIETSNGGLEYRIPSHEYDFDY